MTPQECFRFGFMAGCAAQGIKPEEAEKLAQYGLDMQKRAFDLGLKDLASAATTTLALPAVAAGGAIGLSGIGGMIAGHAARKSQLANPVNVDDVQKQELIAAYNWHRQRIAQELAQRRKAISADMSLEEAGA